MVTQPLRGPVEPGPCSDMGTTWNALNVVFEEKSTGMW